MGKNIMVYFNDEALQFIESMPQRGTLLNELVIEHFSNDEEVLRSKVLSGERDLNRLKAALQDKVDTRLKRETAMRNQDKEGDKELILKRIVDDFATIWAEGKVSDEQYWECFPDKKLPLYDKMSEYLKANKANPLSIIKEGI